MELPNKAPKMASDLRPEAWTISSNEALTVSLVDSEGAVKFHPAFTYPIYGDSEQIFGYQGLNINLAFDSITFKPFVSVKFEKKLNADVDDVEKLLLNKLPDGDTIVGDEALWVDAFEKEQEQFELPANNYFVEDYSVHGNGDKFAIYMVPLSEPSIKKFHRRIQIFTLLFIEAASYIDESDTNWELFLIFNKNTRQCIGYATTYKFWLYQGAHDFEKSNPEEPNTRAKISQFIIFPPYQGKNHGSHLYSAIMSRWLNERSISEITVEDPNESFDDLRDRCDFERLYGGGIFDSIPKELPINETWLENSRRSLKLEKRQFLRLIEMSLLNKKSPNFRLQVKKRIYEKNYEALMDMDDANKRDKIQQSFKLVKDDYQRIISKVAGLKKRAFEDELAAKNKAIKT